MRRGTTQQERSPEIGFTLIELLVVIAIFLIIASFAAPTYTRIVTRSHEAVLKDDLFTLRRMINQYMLDSQQASPALASAEGVVFAFRHVYLWRRGEKRRASTTWLKRGN